MAFTGFEAETMNTEPAESKTPVRRFAIWTRIVKRWDMLVYRFAYKSLQRLCRTDPGMAYLFELSLRKQREQHPIPERLMKAAEHFSDAIDSLRNV